MSLGRPQTIKCVRRASKQKLELCLQANCKAYAVSKVFANGSSGQTVLEFGVHLSPPICSPSRRAASENERRKKRHHGPQKKKKSSESFRPHTLRRRNPNFSSHIRIIWRISCIGRRGPPRTEHPWGRYACTRQYVQHPFVWLTST